MNGRTSDFTEPRDPYFEEIEEERFQSNYPLRRLARFFTYVSVATVGYIGAITAVYFLTSWIKS